MSLLQAEYEPELLDDLRQRARFLAEKNDPAPNAYCCGWLKGWAEIADLTDAGNASPPDQVAKTILDKAATCKDPGFSTETGGYDAAWRDAARIVRMCAFTAPLVPL